MRSGTGEPHQFCEQQHLIRKKRHRFMSVPQRKAGQSPHLLHAARQSQQTGEQMPRSIHAAVCPGRARDTAGAQSTLWVCCWGTAAGRGTDQEHYSTREICTGKKASLALKTLGSLWLTCFHSHLEGLLTNTSKTRKSSTHVKFCRNQISFCT